MDSSPPGSSVHGMSQARILEYAPPGDLPDPGTDPTSPALAGGFFTAEPPRKTYGLITRLNFLLYFLFIFSLKMF